MSGWIIATKWERQLLDLQAEKVAFRRALGTSDSISQEAVACLKRGCLKRQLE
ncbi:MAG TPA: hypothetical protein VLL97_10315 [Acidobacteriota bacterium]|nr:hypothetical protein [Acidobacteriota bacterium]